MIKKKFRFRVQFFKDGFPIGEPELVKISARPPAPIPYPENVRFDLELYYLWREKGWQPEDFNQIKLEMIHPEGSPSEEWLLKDVKLMLPIQNANDYVDEDTTLKDAWQCLFTYGPDIEYNCLRDMEL